jgi:hypothetical protein
MEDAVRGLWRVFRVGFIERSSKMRVPDQSNSSSRAKGLRKRYAEQFAPPGAIRPSEFDVEAGDDGDEGGEQDEMETDSHESDSEDGSGEGAEMDGDAGED